MSRLRLVPPAPVAFCMPWHARGCWSTEPEHGARCCWCSRDVAAPTTAKGLTVACVYCGLDHGCLPPAEQEPRDE